MNKEMKKRLKQLERNQKYGDIYEEKPKKKEYIKVSNRGMYDITLSNFQLHLYELMFMVNGIDPEYYMTITPTAVALVNNVKLDETFMTLSKLDWQHEKGIDTLTFRGRFVTLLLYRLIACSHKIVKHLYDQVGEGKRYASYRIILEEWMCRVDMFISTYLTNNLNYREHLQAVLEMIVAANDEDDEIIKKLEESRAFLINACNHPGKYDDGIICNNIMKMSFVLSTNSMKTKKTPRYIEGIDYRDDDVVVRQVGELGLAIMKRRKSGYIPIMYRCFTKADPEIYTRFENAEDYPEIVIGMRSLELLKMFVDDRGVSKYINRIQQKKELVLRR